MSTSGSTYTRAIEKFKAEVRKQLKPEKLYAALGLEVNEGKGRCPHGRSVHKDENPSCTYEPGEEKAVEWCCRSHGQRSGRSWGDEYDLVTAVKGLDRKKDWPQIMQIVGEVAGVKVPKPPKETQGKREAPAALAPATPLSIDAAELISAADQITDDPAAVAAAIAANKAALKAHWKATRELPHSAECERLYERCGKLAEADYSAARALVEWRGWDRQKVDALDLARVLPDGDEHLPEWAVAWRRRSYHLVAPTWNAKGQVACVRARAHSVNKQPGDPPTEVAPWDSGPLIAGSIFANGPLRVLLEMGPEAFMAKWKEKFPGTSPTILFGEGLPDYLTLSLWAENRALVGGVYKGAWSEDLAEKIPDGCRVIIRTHSDEAGCAYRDEVAEALHPRCTVEVLHPGRPTTEKLPDESDHWRWTSGNRERCDPTKGVVSWDPAMAAPKAKKTQTKSVLEALIELADKFIKDKFTYGGIPYLSVEHGRRRMVVPADSETFKTLLRAWWREAGYKLVKLGQDLTEAQAWVLSQTVDAAEKPLFVRVGHADGKTYIDLAEPATSRAIEVDEGGWRIVQYPACHFVRPGGTLPLPEPVSGGNYNLIWQFLNIEADDRPFVYAWHLSALRGDAQSFMGIAFLGGFESGKTGVSVRVRNAIDPATIPLYGPPKDEETALRRAYAHHAYGVDNLSSLPTWASDAICRISTGAGDEKRKLWTEYGTVEVKICRPVILNGTTAGTRGDLLSRFACVSCKPLPRGRQEGVEDLEVLFAQAHPQILGGLLDALVSGLAASKDASFAYEKATRMARIDKLVAAAEPTLGFPRGAFAAAYRRGAEDAHRIPLEESPLTRPLTDLVADPTARQATAEGRTQVHAEMGALLDRLGVSAPASAPTAIHTVDQSAPIWTGTSDELLAELKSRARKIDADLLGNPRWPGSSDSLGRALRTLSHSLRGAGVVEVDFERRSSCRARHRLITLLRVRPETHPN